MGKRVNVSLSGEHLQLTLIIEHHRDVEAALRHYFSPESLQYLIRFATYSSRELTDELELRLAENEKSTTLMILSSLEAAFRVDYLQRCKQKKKDDLSQALWKIYQQQEDHARLDDIFEAWKESDVALKTLIGKVKGAFNYRHWLAHGRYWTAKFQKYDYDIVYSLAQAVYDNFPFEDT